MLINSDVRKASGRFRKWNLWWPATVDPLSMHADLIRRGGSFKKQNGEIAGNGLFYHYMEFQKIAWPHKVWEKGPFKNHWAEQCLDVWINHQYIGAMGCAASGKSDSFGSLALTDWYCFPDCTTVLVSSTDLKSLELRIWGMIKRYHKEAKARHFWLPGHMIEGKQMLVQDNRNQASEGRDFKNGIIAVACKKGNQFVGLGSMIGIHNKRVRLIADESNLMPRAFLDSTANLAKCEDWKLVALGNPNETTNAHGAICEPAPELGGWEGNIDQTPGTKTWKTRFPNGICVQFPGSDSPNMKAPVDQPPPFPFLITRQQYDDDAKIWGIDDWHFQMMDEARMPRGQGSRRVLTRQACLKFGAFNEPRWRDTRITKIAFLDAAYRGTGGDRCVFGEMQFGPEAEEVIDLGPEVASAIIFQKDKPLHTRQIVNLVDILIVPIVGGPEADMAEDQIAKFCKEQCEGRGIPAENFFYDAGMRTSLTQAMARVWSQWTETIDFGAKPSEEIVSMEINKPCNEYYSKFVTELWFSVRKCVESRQFRGLTEEACNEFSAREWKMVAGNKIEVETKEDMKLKSGRSPDIADAIAAGLFGCRKRGFTISRLNSPPETVKKGGDWRTRIREAARTLHASGNLSYN